MFMFNSEIKIQCYTTLDNAKAGWITSYGSIGTPSFREYEPNRYAVDVPNKGHVGTIQRHTLYNCGEHL